MRPQQPQPSAFQPSPEFRAAAKRMEDATHIRKPDRVPVAPLVVADYATRIKGISNRDAMYIFQKTAEAWRDAAMRHNWDSAASWGTLLPEPTPALERAFKHHRELVPVISNDETIEDMKDARRGKFLAVGTPDGLLEKLTEQDE